MSKQGKKVLLMYPPGPLYQRGEDRCKSNIEASSASSARSCNDLGYAAAVLRKAGYEPRIRDYQTAAYDQARSLSDIYNYQPDLIMISVVDASIVDDLAFIQKIKDRLQDSSSVDGHAPPKDAVYKAPVIVLKGALFFNAPDSLFEQFDFSAELAERLTNLLHTLPIMPSAGWIVQSQFLAFCTKTQTVCFIRPSLRHLTLT
ncbi:MAG: hypothetical protein FWC86_01820 [Coriobacteriia bacterium]|nr:hypothetical protein [Coriobacteriia bacterium]